MITWISRLIGFLIGRTQANLKHLEKMLVSPPTNMRYNPDVPLDEQTDLLTYDQSVWEVDLERVEFCEKKCLNIIFILKIF